MSTDFTVPVLSSDCARVALNFRGIFLHSRCNSWFLILETDVYSCFLGKAEEAVYVENVLRMLGKVV